VRFSLLLIFWFATYVGFSQTEWESLNGPFGGSVEILLQSEQLTLFAGTKQGLFRRPVESSEWSFVSDLGDSEINALISGKNEELFLSNGTDHTIYRSLDDGANWSKSALSRAEGYDDIALASNHTLILAEGNSIWISTEDGQIMERVQLPGDIRILCLAAAKGGRLFAGTNRGLYVSYDDGQEWNEFTQGLSPLLFITHAAIDQEGRAVISTIENRIFILEPLDSVFQEFSSGLEETEVSCLAVDTSMGVIIGTIDGTAHVLDPNSGTWAKLPASEQNAKMLTILPGRQGNIYFARSSKGVQLFDQNCNCTQTINDGLTASEIHNMLISVDSKLIVSTRNELFMYMAADNFWKEVRVNYESISAQSLIQTSDGKIYAGGSDGVLEIVLDPDGATVDSIGPFGYSISFLAVDSQNRLVAGSATEGLFVRDLEVMLWTDLRTEEMLDAVLTDLHFANDSSIYVSYHQGIFKSEDSGQNWYTAVEGIPQVGSLVTDLNGNIFGASFPGVVRSTDGGEQWEHKPVGDNHRVTDLLAVERGVLLAGTSDGIFRSQDDGGNWEAYTQGLGVKSIGSLIQDLEGNIYAGTLGGGVYFLEQEVNAVGSQVPLSLDLQVFPNPTSGSKISIQSREWRGDVEIRIYSSDLRIAFRENQYVAKRGRAQVEVSNLSPGLYFISVTTKEGTEVERFIKM